MNFVQIFSTSHYTALPVVLSVGTVGSLVNRIYAKPAVTHTLACIYRSHSATLRPQLQPPTIPDEMAPAAGGFRTRVGLKSLSMATVVCSAAAGDPVRNEKIPRSQQRSAIKEGVAMQLQDAAERGSAASILSISNFLKNISDGAKNPKTNLNAMRVLVQTRQARPDAASGAVGGGEDVVLLRSGDVSLACRMHYYSDTCVFILMFIMCDGIQVTITAAHHRSMNQASEGRHERCRRSWKSDAAIHPFSCMVGTSVNDIDGIIAQHALLKRSFDTRKERKRLVGAFEASKRAVAARVITPITFYEKPPVLGEIAQYECAYFKLDPKTFLQDKIEKEGGRWSIAIEVRAITGDPDLIISTTSKYPSDKDYTWRSMGGGDDRISIAPPDPNYPGDGQGHWQPLFIAVPCVGASACRFNLFASVVKWTDVESDKRRMQAAVDMQV